MTDPVPLSFLDCVHQRALFPVWLNHGIKTMFEPWFLYHGSTIRSTMIRGLTMVLPRVTIWLNHVVKRYPKTWLNHGSIMVFLVGKLPLVINEPSKVHLRAKRPSLMDASDRKSTKTTLPGDTSVRPAAYSLVQALSNRLRSLEGSTSCSSNLSYRQW